MSLNFPTSKNDWRLDVVSLLAVIGESSMSKHAQPLTASWLCLLPRLLPAPQALIRPARPGRLPAESAQVIGVHNGILIQELNYFANLIYPISELKKHTVLEATIKHRAIREEHKGVVKDRIKEIVPNPLSFLNFLTVGSSLLSLGLLVWSVVHKDGPACLAIAVMSFTSTLVGWASYWHPLLTERGYKSDVPPGDIVIRTRNGAFVIIHCTEEVARELFVGAEDCAYALRTRPAQVLVGTGTILLMIGVVLVGNCSIEMQIALGVSYIALNGLYWVASLLPPLTSWDLKTRYEWCEEPAQHCVSFTLTLFQAALAASRKEDGQIGEIKTSWLRTSHAAPDTPVWKKWLDELAEKGNTEIDGNQWDPVACWNEIKATDDLERGVTKVNKDSSPNTPVIRRPTDDLEIGDNIAVS